MPLRVRASRQLMPDSKCCAHERCGRWSQKNAPEKSQNGHYPMSEKRGQTCFPF